MAKVPYSPQMPDCNLFGLGFLSGGIFSAGRIIRVDVFYTYYNSKINIKYFAG